MKTNGDIAAFLERKLWVLNKDHAGIRNPAASGSEKVKAAAERYNAKISNQLGFDGIEMSEQELKQLRVQIPAAFKDKPVTYTATANHLFADGSLAGQTEFGIDVIL